MQTTQEKLNVIQKRVIAAQNALKLSDKIGPKIAVKEAEIAAIQASFDTCPEGQTKSGLAKRLSVLLAAKNKLVVQLDTLQKTAEYNVDMDIPFTAVQTEPPAATGTEGGENNS